MAATKIPTIPLVWTVEAGNTLTLDGVPVFSLHRETEPHNVGAIYPSNHDDIAHAVCELLNRALRVTIDTKRSRTETARAISATLKNAPIRPSDRPKTCCTTCGGFNVQIASWTRPNTGEIVGDFGTWNAGDNTFCEDCQQNTSLVHEASEPKLYATARARWAELNPGKGE